MIYSKFIYIQIIFYLVLFFYKNRYEKYLKNKEILNSVLRLFGVSPKHFLELDNIKEELHVCSQLFDLSSRFKKFNTGFRNTLWKNLDLKTTKHVVSCICNLNVNDL